MEKDGVEFLKSIGVQKGHRILDFGCGEGHYTIPASCVVGSEGVVYGLDKNSDVLEKIQEIAENYELGNIELINEASGIPIEDNKLDTVLCYDVIHYEEKNKREKIYREVYRVLKEGGLFSVYPKHHKNDYPMNKIATMKLDDIVKEIEDSGFELEGKFWKTLLHDDYLNEGYILNFKK